METVYLFQRFLKLVSEYFRPITPENLVTLGYFIHHKFPDLDAEQEDFIVKYGKEYGLSQYYFGHIKPLIANKTINEIAPAVCEVYLHTHYAEKLSKLFNNPELFTTFKPLDYSFFGISYKEAVAPSFAFADEQVSNYFTNRITDLFFDISIYDNDRAQRHSVNQDGLLVELDFPEQISYLDKNCWHKVIRRNVGANDRCFYFRDRNNYKASWDERSFGVLIVISSMEYPSYFDDAMKTINRITLYPGRDGLAVYSFDIFKPESTNICLLYLWLYFSSHFENKRQNFFLADILYTLGVYNWCKPSTMYYNKATGCF